MQVGNIGIFICTEISSEKSFWLLSYLSKHCQYARISEVLFSYFYLTILFVYVFKYYNHQERFFLSVDSTYRSPRVYNKFVFPNRKM
jgi:hypothetical protein